MLLYLITITLDPLILSDGAFCSIVRLVYKNNESITTCLCHVMLLDHKVFAFDNSLVDITGPGCPLKTVKFDIMFFSAFRLDTLSSFSCLVKFFCQIPSTLNPHIPVMLHHAFLSDSSHEQ